MSSHPDSTVTRRELSADPVPSTAWADAVTAKFVAPDERSAGQKQAQALASTFADEMLNADALLFAVPLYNYGVSQHFKTWFDLAYTDPRIDPEGTALRGKPATLVTVLGGNYSPGTPKEGWDHSTAWLRRVLEDVWGLDLRVVQRPFTLVGVNPAMDAFTDVAQEFKEKAEESARVYGQELAARRKTHSAA